MEYQIVNKGIQATREKDSLYITSIINSGLKDISNDKLTEKAMQSIIKQATSHNLHMEHGKTFDDVLGPIIEAKRVPEGIKIKSKIRPDKENKIQPLLDAGVNIGSSISGVPIRKAENLNDIMDWQLIEVSLTPIPADQSTMGKTVVAKDIKGIIDKATTDLDKGDDKMADKEAITQEEVIDLINTAFNEKQEALVEDIVKQANADQQTEISELQEEIATFRAEVEELKKSKDDSKNQDDKKVTDDTDAQVTDKQINLEDLINKSATEGALTALQQIFGRSNNKIDVKYTDKDYKFNSQPKGIKKQSNDDKDDGLFDPSFIASQI